MDDTLPPPDTDFEIFPGTNFLVHRPSKVVHLERPVPWVWDGYLARGSITLLTGWWKIGKSTLLSALLGRLGSGGDLAGRAVVPGKALVVSEEGLGPWLRRFGRHGIGTGRVSQPPTPPGTAAAGMGHAAPGVACSERPTGSTSSCWTPCR